MRYAFIRPAIELNPSTAIITGVPYGDTLGNPQPETEFGNTDETGDAARFALHVATATQTAVMAIGRPGTGLGKLNRPWGLRPGNLDEVAEEYATQANGVLAEKGVTTTHTAARSADALLALAMSLYLPTTGITAVEPVAMVEVPFSEGLRARNWYENNVEAMHPKPPKLPGQEQNALPVSRFRQARDIALNSGGWRSDILYDQLVHIGRDRPKVTVGLYLGELGLYNTLYPQRISGILRVIGAIGQARKQAGEAPFFAKTVLEATHGKLVNHSDEFSNLIMHTRTAVHDRPADGDQNP